MAQNTPDHILIIGAGIAGLVLAQGLRLHSIPFRLFERHPRSYRAQGHRFRITKEAHGALKSVLPLDLQHLLIRTAPANSTSQLQYVDARKLEFSQSTPPNTDSFPIDRRWIRLLATLDIDDAIEYEKEFESYECQDDRVRVKFLDGSTACGMLLVGADGIKSRVRTQLQPTRKLLDLEHWVMWGRTPLTDSLKKDLPPDMLTWCMYLDDEANVQMVVEPVMWPTSIQKDPEGRLPDFQDYIYWGTCTASFQYAEALPNTAEQRKAYLERMIENWHPLLKRMLAEASHEVSACAPILSSKPDIELGLRSHTEPVTLVGDAAHAMSPMGASGGDTAIRNAVDLVQTIADGVTAKSIADFEARMADRSKDKIEHSFRGGQKFWGKKEWTEYAEQQ